MIPDIYTTGELRNTCRRHCIQVGTIDGYSLNSASVMGLVMLATDRDFSHITESTLRDPQFLFVAGLINRIQNFA